MLLIHPGDPVKETQSIPKNAATTELEQIETSYLLLFAWILLGSAGSSLLLTLALRYFTFSHKDKRKRRRKIAQTSSEDDTRRQGGSILTGRVRPKYWENPHGLVKMQRHQMKPNPTVKQTEKKNKQRKSFGVETSQLIDRNSPTNSSNSSDRLVDVVDLRKRRSLSSLMGQPPSEDE